MSDERVLQLVQQAHGDFERGVLGAAESAGLVRYSMGCAGTEDAQGSPEEYLAQVGTYLSLAASGALGATDCLLLLRNIKQRSAAPTACVECVPTAAEPVPVAAEPAEPWPAGPLCVPTAPARPRPFSVTVSQLFNGSGKVRHFDCCFLDRPGAPSRPWLLSTGEDGMMRVWDIEGRRATAVVAAHSSEALRVAALRGGSVVATGGAEGEVALFSAAGTLEDGRAPDLVARLSLEGEDAQVYAIGGVGRNADELFAASNDTVSFFNLDTQAQLRRISYPKLGALRHGGERNKDDLAYVFDAALLGDDLLLAACSDGSVRCNAVGDSRSVAVVPDAGFGQYVTSIHVVPDSNYFAACGGAGALLLFDIRTWECVVQIPDAHDGPVYGAETMWWGPKQVLATWSSDQTVRFFDLEALVSVSQGGAGEDVLLHAQKKRGYPVYNAAFHRASGVLACAGGDQSVLACPLLLLEANEP